MASVSGTFRSPENMAEQLKGIERFLALGTRFCHILYVAGPSDGLADGGCRGCVGNKVLDTVSRYAAKGLKYRAWV